MAEYCWLSRCKDNATLVAAGTPGWGVVGLGPTCKWSLATVAREEVYLLWGPTALEGV